ncbi:MAG: DUF2029 domain-containing protein [Acidobacteria bacterium]|nr:DUF2029 domain-containing protein [Acidobacteriota bacterium]
MLAALVRIPFVLLPPILSDDVYRHRWDGRVLAAGIDPYLAPPASRSLEALRDEEWRRVNHKDIRTVYGPAAQGLLGILALSPAKASLTSIKAMAAFFDVLSVACLAWLGAPFAAFLYAVHPLAIFETAGEGHLDGVAVSVLLLAFVLFERAKGKLSAAALALAPLVKLTPLVAAPVLLKRLGSRGAFVFAAVIGLAHVPFLSSGGPLAGLSVYAERWEANGFLYPGLVRGLDAVDGAAHAKTAYAGLKALLGHPDFMDRGWGFLYTGFLARALLGLALLVVLARIYAKNGDDAFRTAGLALVALLAVSPTLHPWYLLHVLPFALAYRWTSVAWVAGALPLSYLHPPAQSGGTAALALWAVAYVPALALYVLVDRRRGA